MTRTVVKFGTALLGSLALVACGGSSGDDDGDDTIDPPDTGAYHHYVNDSVQVPDNSTEASMFGLDLDGDPQGKPDNALGNILATLAAQDVDIQTQVDDALAEGSLILLHSIRTDDDTLTADTSVSWQVYLGDSTAAPPMYNGQDMFTIASNSPTNALLVGSLVGGFFSGGPGEVTIQLSLTGGTPLQIKLIGTRIEADTTASGCTNGRLGGAITQEELNNSVIPGIADLLGDSIGTPATCSMANTMCNPDEEGDPTTCDTERNICVDSTASTVLDLFDDDKNGMITAMEIQNDPLIMALLAPDVDLLDASGKFNPRSDGTKDSLSLGLGFTCVGAVFTASGE